MGLNYSNEKSIADGVLIFAKAVAKIADAYSRQVALQEQIVAKGLE